MKKQQIFTSKLIGATLLLAGGVLSLNNPQQRVKAEGMDEANISVHSIESEFREDSPIINTNSSFINTISTHAFEVAKAHNIYPSVMIAQATLESGYGGSELSQSPNHNLFGIKGAYNGASVSFWTNEYINGEKVRIQDSFKKYPTFTESFNDNAQLIRNGTSWNSSYYSGAWVENTPSYKEATASLQGRYATDPAYASKLNNIIVAFELDKLDVLAYGEGVRPVEDGPVTPNTSSQTASYTVVSGDTLSKISGMYGTTVKELKQLNGLTSDLIFVGQSLKVKTSNSSTENLTKPEVKPAPTPNAEQSKPNETNKVYTIVAGDTLSKIARQFNTSVKLLKDNNKLKSDLIFIGQKLVIGTQNTKPKVETPGNSNPKPSEDNRLKEYKVIRGDTLFKIAGQYKTTVTKIKQLNNLKSDLIYIGQVLKVGQEQVQQNTTTQSTTTHQVRSGDTLFAIANKYGTSVSRIKSLNGLKSDLIFVNQELKVK